MSDHARRMPSDDAPRIVAVDDQPDVLDLLAVILRREGYAVEPTTNGGQVLEAVERLAPSLVLVDLVMPRIDGWEVLERLKRLPGAPPAVALTA